MGTQRKDVATRFLERLAALDADAAVSMVTPDYQGRGAPELPISGKETVYRGHEGLRAWIAETAADWGAYQVGRLRFRDYGDALLVVGDNRAVGQRNPFGSTDHRPFVCVMRFEGDLIRSVHAYARYEDALQSEGLGGSAER